MRILIVGGGLAGLSLLRLLHDAGHDVRVVERADRFRRVGYGIGLWGDTWRMLGQLGVADSAGRAGVPVSRWEVRDARGQVLSVLEPPSGEAGSLTRHDAAQLSFTVIHRADLHQAIRAAVPDDRILMGTGVRAIEQDRGGATVTLTDGRPERADLVVGADGVNSRVRELVFGQGARNLGTAAWAFWVPDRVDVPDGFTELWGADGKALLVGGVAGKRMATLCMPVAPGTDIGDPLSYAQARAGEWVLPELLEAVAEAGEDVFFDRNRVVRPNRLHRGRVVLIGDAAHAVHPIVGMGASLALEDASVLADELDGAWRKNRDRPARGNRDVPPEITHMALDRFTRRRRGPVRRAHVEAALARRLVLTGATPIQATRNLLAARTPVFEWFFARQAQRSPGCVPE